MFPMRERLPDESLSLIFFQYLRSMTKSGVEDLEMEEGRSVPP